MPIHYGWDNFRTSYILANLDSAEYAALNDTKRDYFHLIISAGVVNFHEGSPIWNAVMVTLFPEGTATHAALKTFTTRVYGEPAT